MIEYGWPRIEVAVVAEGCWRICEAGLDEHDPARLVAFFERQDDHIAVVWLRGTDSPTRFSTFDEALDAACALVSDQPTLGPRARRPVPIPHHAPRTGSGL